MGSSDDPYRIVENWKNDLKPMSAVSWGGMYNYLVNSPSEYTYDKLKAYKSLEAFNFFVCYHVQDIYKRIRILKYYNKVTKIFI